MIALRCGPTELDVVPDRGGGIARFTWHDKDVFRPAVPGDDSPLALACFPLVPFSNRIARGAFAADGRDVRLPPNLPGGDHPHPLHGFGWQARWQVARHRPDSARLVHEHHAGAWPWRYRAEQTLQLGPDGYRHSLSLTNLGDTAMPAGLGLHPYFPKAEARLTATFDGFWETTADCLPVRWHPLDTMPDWLADGPIDTVFTGRAGDVVIDWPGRRLTMTAAADLAFTVIYHPQGASFFCVEPVSHMTDAINRAEPPETTGLAWLEPGATWRTRITFRMTDT